METSQLDPKLSLQPFDPEVFQRVWNRVMPDQDRSPIAMDAPAQPAVPALSPVPEQPPETPPQVPLTCLGEGSRPYTQAIRDMMDQTRGFLRSLQTLSRRSGSRAARVLSGIAGDLRREERRQSQAQVKFDQGLVIDYGARCVYQNGEPVHLAKKEFDILELLSLHPSQVFDREHIYDSVWGWDSEAVENHVEVYVGFLRKKLANIGSGIKIKSIRSLGYHLEVSDDD